MATGTLLKNAVLLWENPSPNSSFAEQEVTLSDSVENYTFIYVVFLAGTSSEQGVTDPDVTCPPVIFPVGRRSHGFYWEATGSGSTVEAFLRIRQITAISGNKVTFSRCFENRAGYATANSKVIPRYIYGIRD